MAKFCPHKLYETYMSNNTYKLFILEYCNDTVIKPGTSWKQMALFGPVFSSQVGYVITNNRRVFGDVNFRGEPWDLVLSCDSGCWFNSSYALKMKYSENQSHKG